MNGPPIRLGYLVDTIASDTAGTEKQLLETIRRLNRSDFETSMICLWQSDWLKRNEVPCPVDFLGYEGFIHPTFPRVLGRCVSLLERRRYDIVQTFFEDSVFVAYFGAAVSRAPPVLLSSRRDIGMGSQVAWYHKLFPLVRAHIQSSFSGIVVNAEDIKHHVMLTENVPESKLKVITNGIRIPDRGSSAPPILSADPSATWIVIAANLKPIKRIDLFLRALALVRDRSRAPFRAVVLGEGPDRPSLLELTAALRLESTVTFAGKVADVPSYLQHASIGVLCSDREGLSNAVLEYMACGLPVVATRVGGNSEFVDASNGALVPAGDAEALASALQTLVENPDLRSKQGARSLEKVESSFSWKKNLAELESYYKSLVHRR